MAVARRNRRPRPRPLHRRMGSAFRRGRHLVLVVRLVAAPDVRAFRRDSPVRHRAVRPRRDFRRAHRAHLHRAEDSRERTRFRSRFG